MENALVDIKAKALGISVHEMLGGALRDPIRLYWSHCGSYHVSNHELLGVDPIQSLDDIKALGAQVKESGYHALKCNLMMFDRAETYMYGPGWVGGNGDADRNPVRAATHAAIDQILFDIKTHV